jgi:hypothetical protein
MTVESVMYVVCADLSSCLTCECLLLHNAREFRFNN